MIRKLKVFLMIGLLVVPLVAANSNMAEANVDSVIEATVDPLLMDFLENNDGPAQVIVTFKGDDRPEPLHEQILKNIGIDAGVLLKNLHIAGVLATKAQVQALAANEEVVSVFLNRKLEYYNEDATKLTGVDRVHDDQTMAQQNGGMAVTGEGVGVLINDSGIDGTHQDHQLGSNLVQNVQSLTELGSLTGGLVPVSYVENVLTTDVTSGHGTHVAGTVGGTGAMSDGKYEGVAPGADLIGFGSGAALFILDGLGGFDYALEHQEEYNIRVITNSWGGSGDFDPTDPITIASKMAYDRGMTVLFAAGNEGPGEDTHNIYAKAPWVISVAAGEKDGKTLADFSSRGKKGAGGTFTIDGESWTWKDEPTITAPGVDIISTRAIAPVPLLDTVGPTTIELAYLPYYTMMSGTSMATPHVAGIIALMLDANPSLSPDEVKQIIQTTATPMPGYESWEAGAGYVNAYEAVESAFAN